MNTCIVCEKEISDGASTCGAKCRQHKKRVNDWIKKLHFHQLQISQANGLTAIALKRGLVCGGLAFRALEATQNRAMAWGDWCAWCGEEVANGAKYCSTSCRANASRHRAKCGEPRDTWGLWFMALDERWDWIKSQRRQAWGILRAIEWRYNFSVAVEIAVFCFEHRNAL